MSRAPSACCNLWQCSMLILMPDWQYRYYSFDAHWGNDEMLGLYEGWRWQ